MVNGNSLEADLPFLAFWMAGIALFVAAVADCAATALALAAMTAYQAMLATPILMVYCWLHAAFESGLGSGAYAVMVGCGLSSL